MANEGEVESGDKGAGVVVDVLTLSAVTEAAFELEAAAASLDSMLTTFTPAGALLTVVAAEL